MDDKDTKLVQKLGEVLKDQLPGFDIKGLVEKLSSAQKSELSEIVFEEKFDGEKAVSFLAQVLADQEGV